MKIIRDSAISANKEVPFTFFKNENQTDSLAIILPGVGYTAQAPLLHYSSGIYRNKGYDVLQVNYHYSPETISFISDEEFTADVQSVLDKIWLKNSYNNYTVIAKSMGTIALPYLLDQPTFTSANVIWLTPLLKRSNIVHTLLTKSNRGLCIIGNQDPHYLPETFEKVKSNTNVIRMLINGVDHGLEDESDLMKSLHVLKEVMMKIKDFESV
ncbi:alpha/beta hydrolase [Bacillus sp. FJAT-49736]|uniref:alpha/beta hydrolase n=1 Tax=Bacillus sp. FJAT-49736 TaxID=2833582 RepID=UPI001BC9E08F|nr:alpha/beta hydrolase [Bacillus sp. FJAT-49736]MBS4172731.1 alpha/beta hydrolase [Bacillus sp. FJAT-49736]